MTIQYQNNRSGVAYDITQLVTAASWETKRTGCPARLALFLVDDPVVEWVEGGTIAMKDGDKGLFFGYVFVIERKDEESLSITAYDQTRYLKNKDTYVFTGKRADEILSKVAADFRLKIAKLPNTGYVIPTMIMDIKPLFDTVLEAIDRTLIYGGRMFYLWDDFGALQLSEVKIPARMPILGAGNLVTGYDYKRSIDGETYNKIKLVQDNETTKKRDVYIAMDSYNMGLWGILQLSETVDEGFNDAQIQEQCMNMLELYNRPEHTLSIRALAVKWLRAGQVIFVDFPKIKLTQTFLVEEVSHDLVAETMDLKVKVAL